MKTLEVGLTSHVSRTELGWIGVVWRGQNVRLISFGHRLKTGLLSALPAGLPKSGVTPAQRDLMLRLEAFAAGMPDDFGDVALDFGSLTSFQCQVLVECRKVPWGQTCSYSELAARIGSPKAARAVGSALGKNPFPLVIPCHRIISAAGLGRGGFSAPGGMTTKRRLLAAEQ